MKNKAKNPKTTSTGQSTDWDNNWAIFQRAKVNCPRGHSLNEPLNQIAGLTKIGRACRSCDNAARRARHLELEGEERETYIQARADHNYSLIISGVAQ